jgi:protein involved in ribonucleotide reduction
LSQIREKFQSVEPDFKAATGYEFDALTESEARYLAKHDNAQSIRDRIIAAGNAAGIGANAGDTR